MEPVTTPQKKFSAKYISNRFEIPVKTVLGYLLRRKFVPEYYKKRRLYMLSFDEMESLVKYYSEKKLNKAHQVIFSGNNFYDLYPSKLNYVPLNQL